MLPPLNLGFACRKYVSHLSTSMVDALFFYQNRKVFHHPVLGKVVGRHHDQWSASFILVKNLSSALNIALVAFLGDEGTGILMGTQKMCCRSGAHKLFATKALAAYRGWKNLWLLPKENSSSSRSSLFAFSLMNSSECLPSSSDLSVSISWLDVFDLRESWIGVWSLLPLHLGVHLVCGLLH